jgi:beta-lactamase regulating signal transducer with metallopeptidase domain
MTAVMAYVILIAAGVSACAFLGETLLRSRAKPGRWVWVAALLLTAVATILAIIVPRPSNARDGNQLLVIESVPIRTDQVVAPSPDDRHFGVNALFGIADVVLPPAWLALSAGLLVAIAFGRRKLNRERIRAERAQLAGHGVLVTDNVGPAVAGIRQPVVLVPRWVFALDDPSQRLLMAHEMEHVRRRDTALLFAGATSAALMPWNPVVWWMVGRLRLAVEQDCDARVLAAHPGVRRYADLLLTAASRHGLTSRLLAAHFGEHTSDLLRRIEAMTNREQMPWRKLVMGALASLALIAVACETPRPDPIAPIALGAGKSAAAEQIDMVEVRKPSSESKHSVVVLSSDGTELARYAGEIPVRHLPPDGIQSIRAEERPCGADDCFAVRITLKPGQALNVEEGEVRKLPYKIPRSGVLQSIREFKVPEIEARKAKTALLMKDATLIPEDESLPGRATLSGSAQEIRSAEERKLEAIRSAEERRLLTNKVLLLDSQPPRVILRGGTAPWNEVPNILILRSDGTELKRILAATWQASAKSPIDDILPADIQEIEVIKARNCGPMPCPLIRITLMPGRDAKYRK